MFVEFQLIVVSHTHVYTVGLPVSDKVEPLVQLILQSSQGAYGECKSIGFHVVARHCVTSPLERTNTVHFV